ncbi:MAG: hypothetical protein PHP41_03410 [Bacilli bacterium]|jgi:hypothetical protein|nr:hypothetical protein [Bacilli bacterium]MDY0064325.1 hypothetical protein [Bacilli bacterium]
MKKLAKVFLCLTLIAMLCFATMGVRKDGPGPDDRPIGYINVSYYRFDRKL